MPDMLISAMALLFLALVWTAVSTSGWLPQGYLPTPSELGVELSTLFTLGYKGVSIWHHMGISLFRTLTGFLLGVSLGIPLGLLTGYSRVGSAMVSPIMAFIRPIPPIAFIPMVVLYFGLGETGKVALIFWTAFNYLHVNAHAGAANVPIAYQRAAQSIGLTPTQTFFRVVLPSAIPQIFTGLKVGMALSWAVVVAAELAGAQSGLGYMISDAALTFRISAVFIGIALIGAIGLMLNIAINLLETKLVHWKGRG
jgi:NitT/TauT family transport system permease protein